MKIKDGFILRTVAGQNVVVPVGTGAVNFNGMVSFNESGAFLWSLLTNDTTKEQLVCSLLKEYEVEEIRAEADVTAFLAKLREAKLLDE